MRVFPVFLLALFLASCSTSEDRMKYLVSLMDNPDAFKAEYKPSDKELRGFENITLLHYAIKDEGTEVFEFLLDQGMDIKLERYLFGHTNTTVLDEVMASENMKLVSLVYNRFPEEFTDEAFMKKKMRSLVVTCNHKVLGFLLEQGHSAKISLVNPVTGNPQDIYSLLHYAVMDQDRDRAEIAKTVELLLNHGADANSQIDPNKRTPVFYVEDTQKGIILSHFTSAGVDYTIEDRFGHPAMYYYAYDSFYGSLGYVLGLGVKPPERLITQITKEEYVQVEKKVSSFYPWMNTYSTRQVTQTTKQTEKEKTTYIVPLLASRDFCKFHPDLVGQLTRYGFQKLDVQ